MDILSEYQDKAWDLDMATGVLIGFTGALIPLGLVLQNYFVIAFAIGAILISVGLMKWRHRKLTHLKETYELCRNRAQSHTLSLYRSNIERYTGGKDLLHKGS